MYQHKFARHKTREVRVGSLAVGGNNPIWVQSMTTPDTHLVEAGKELHKSGFEDEVLKRNLGTGSVARAKFDLADDAGRRVEGRLAIDDCQSLEATEIEALHQFDEASSRTRRDGDVWVVPNLAAATALLLAEATE